MRVLVWHWGRRGAGPMIAARLTEAINALPGHQALLSLPETAEIFTGGGAQDCVWREPTYETHLGYLAQWLSGPLRRRRTRRHLSALRPDIAICAMPALLDSRMLAGLRALHVPYAVIVHDATAHPGDWLSFRMLGQKRLWRGASHVFCLTSHVEKALRAQGVGRGAQGLTRLWLPPLGMSVPPPRTVSGAPRLLHFGRLLPYKGLDLLLEALELLGPERDFELRVCGAGPDSPTLRQLAAMRGVTVENRWFGDDELPALLGWADALVLPYREASQSGVAALGIAAGRAVLATNVGGLSEQLSNVPGAMLCTPDAPAIAEGLRMLSAQLLLGSPQLPAATAAPNWQALAAAMLSALDGKTEEAAAFV